MTTGCETTSAPIPATAGIGLRADHYRRIDAERPALIGWLEVHSENYFGRGGVPHYYLERLGDVYPLSFHGVGLSLGSTDALDRNHLARLAELVLAYRPALVSEHLSWSSVDGLFVNDLLPLPYTTECLDHFCRRVDQVQTRLGRPILIENPSTYLEFEDQDFTETEFMNHLAERTGCGLLLDVNNVYVCAMNHQFDPLSYIDEIDLSAVAEIHLAGHVANRFTDGGLLIDTHNRPVCDAVWELFRQTIAKTGPLPTLIEWDTDVPELEVLLAEAARARAILEANRAHAA